MTTAEANLDFVNSVVDEIVQPGMERLMESQYFADLRAGKLSVKQLQGFAIQHYIHNITINKGFVLAAAKSAANDNAFNAYTELFLDEASHPEMVKKFGMALGLREEDFAQAYPIFECMAHTSSIVRGLYMGAMSENRASALANESMVRRYSEEFDTYLRKHYDLSESALEFFVVHKGADVEHTRRSAQSIARLATTPQEQEVVRKMARYQVRFKLAKFDGIYREYA